MNLTSKNAIVTGGTKGIGHAIAEALIGEGISVCISARKQGEIDEAVKELNQSGPGKATGSVCDVRDYDQRRALFKRTASEFGGVDILINNAGIGIFESVEKMSPEDFRAILETNVFGVFYCCHEAIPLMKRRGGGYIFNVSSLAGKNAFANGTAYNASKFGLNGFSEALMMDVRYDGIRVSYLMPGSVATDFGRGSSQKAGWALTPADVADVVIDLLRSPARALYSRVEMRPSQPPRKA